MRLMIISSMLIINLCYTQAFGQRRRKSIEKILLSKQAFNSIDTSLYEIGLNKISDFQYKYGINEQLYSFSKNRYDNSIKLVLLKAEVENHKECVLYYEVFKGKKEKRILSSFYDSANVDIIINRFSKIGLSSLNIHDELTYGQPGSNLFGYACGFAAKMPYHGEKLLQILKKEDIDRLFKWLTSINPYKQAYGYLGIRIMIARGKQLTDKQNIILTKFMDDIYGYNKYYYIESCSGCVVWSQYSLKELLHSDFMKTMIRLYNKLD